MAPALTFVLTFMEHCLVAFHDLADSSSAGVHVTASSVSSAITPAHTRFARFTVTLRFGANDPALTFVLTLVEHSLVAFHDLADSSSAGVHVTASSVSSATTPAHTRFARFTVTLWLKWIPPAL